MLYAVRIHDLRILAKYLVIQPLKSYKSNVEVTYANS
jgi:hypothetical protein